MPCTRKLVQGIFSVYIYRISPDFFKLRSGLPKILVVRYTAQGGEKDDKGNRPEQIKGLYRGTGGEYQ